MFYYKSQNGTRLGCFINRNDTKITQINDATTKGLDGVRIDNITKQVSRFDHKVVQSRTLILYNIESIPIAQFVYQLRKIRTSKEKELRVITTTAENRYRPPANSPLPKSVTIPPPKPGTTRI